MRYIIKGNDFSFTWTIKDCNGYVDLSAVTDLKVMYQHSTVPWFFVKFGGTSSIVNK